MPAWLLPVLVSAAISGLVSVGASYVSHLTAMRLMMQAIAEHVRRLDLLEKEKLDEALHYAHKDDLMNRINVAHETAKSIGHRVNGVDQRMTAMDDRIDRLKGVA